MKKTIIFLALLLNLVPYYYNKEKCSLITPGNVAAQSYGEEGGLPTIYGDDVVITAVGNSSISSLSDFISLLPTGLPSLPTIYGDDVVITATGTAYGGVVSISFSGSDNSGAPMKIYYYNPSSSPAKPSGTTIPKDSCSQQSMNNANTTTWVMAQNWGLQIENAQISSSFSGVEKAVTLSYSSQCGCYKASDIFSGTSNEVNFDVSLTQFYPDGSGMFNYYGTVAQAHTHLAGYEPAPSATDLYTLAEEGTANLMFKNIYTLGANGSQYSIYVEDIGKLTTMLSNYPKANEVNAVTHDFDPSSDMGREFLTAKQEYKNQKYSENDAYALALAYVLNTFDTGVKLLEKDGNKFKELHAKADTDATGNKTYKASECK